MAIPAAVAADTAADTIAACDTLAADPDDVDRPANVKGVEEDAMDKQTAILVCREAVKIVEGGGAKGPSAAVDTRRTYYQLGRAIGATWTAEAGLSGYPPESKPWLEKAASAGSAEAMNALGILEQLGLGSGGKGANYVAARGWYEKAAAAGKAAAMVSVGTLYLNGSGVTQDYDAARGWFQKAVAMGFPGGMIALGTMYLSGQGVAKSDVAARLLFEKAVATDPKAASDVASVYSLRDEYAAAIPWYERAAAAGDASAMSTLGEWYVEGRTGVPQDYALARSWYDKGAALGDDDCMIGMGDLYANGRGVPKNLVAARAWYEKAVAKGSTVARERIAALSKN